MITLAAYVGETEDEVLGAATDPDCAAALTENNISLLKSGAIGGLNGLLAGLAPRYGLRGICLLATTSGSEPVDIAAAGRLLAAIKELLNLELDLTVLSPFAEEQEIEAPSEIDMNYR
ncbi:MAG: PAC2 family protein [Euryarchaeota archaeon ADurb.Bin190]|nr:MAG: PAC2 family protein [Euryarchaeota archaeon ADurb.Bin190]